jgi:hypothetical protein
MPADMRAIANQLQQSNPRFGSLRELRALSLEQWAQVLESAGVAADAAALVDAFHRMTG